MRTLFALAALIILCAAVPYRSKRDTAENGNPFPVNHIEPVKTYVYTANGQFVAEMDAASTFRFEAKLQRTKRQQNQQNYGQAMEERQRAEWDRAERERLRREKCKQKKQQQVRPTNPPSPGQTMPIRDNCEPYPAREQTYPIPCPQPCPPAPQPQRQPMPCPQIQPPCPQAPQPAPPCPYQEPQRIVTCLPSPPPEKYWELYKQQWPQGAPRPQDSQHQQQQREFRVTETAIPVPCPPGQMMKPGSTKCEDVVRVVSIDSNGRVEYSTIKQN
ncbi:hypothetical protein WR25_26881 [Diploscapter pachys]|uniref:Uncharacterized protein n=1 Tax=Diploscapter pachys TaxID=2018661 RepID=A0A2A2J6R3_9BILA|nr:hypothetical protein WR25_26881 [Diploscapter pachys]